MRISSGQTGGDVARAAIARARDNARAASSRKVAVGIFEDSRYPDGMQTAAVAMAHEFGLGAVPERAFFRAALPAIVRRVRAIVADRGVLDLNDATLDAIGAAAAEELRRSAEQLSSPPLAASTRRARQRKGRRLNPLIDSRKLVEAITHRIEGTPAAPGPRRDG